MAVAGELINVQNEIANPCFIGWAMAMLFSPKIISNKTQVVHTRKLVWCSTFVNNFMPKSLQAQGL